MGALEGKTAIVTGASRGIGRAVAIELARHGMNVAVGGRTTESKGGDTIDATAELARKAGGRAIAVAADVRDEARIAELVRATVDEFGGIDLLVNTAAAFGMKPAVSLSTDELRVVLDVNITGAFACTMACVPHLRRSENAHVVNLAPPPRFEAYWAASRIPYAVSKVGLSMLTLGLAEELRGAGISVSGLWPKVLIASGAIDRLGGGALTRLCRRGEIVGEALVLLVTRPLKEATGRFWLDEDLLRAAGVEDFTRFAVDPSSPSIASLFVDPKEPLES
jgi:citronellol/citronellal dehydrogenase